MSTDVDEHAVMTPMWRGVVVFRVVALGVAVVNVVRLYDGYRLPQAAVAAVALMAAWTVFSSVRYLRHGDRRVAWAELVGIPALTLATLVVDDPARIADGGPVLTTLWSAGPVLALGVAAGWRGGLLASVVTVATLAAVRRTVDPSFLYDAQLLLVAGLAVGLAADTMRASSRRLQRAVAAEAATAERERLARDIHDGVLQVLAFVRRRGVEVSRTDPAGPVAELARLAGEQEVALRRLVTTGPPSAADGGDVDLSGALAAVIPTDGSLAAPARPVLVAHPVATSLVAVVREAVANTRAHAGPGARTWVLVEEDGPAGAADHVVVSVRDDGCGIPEGRLTEAEAGGHLGVASSMRGRVEEMGGVMTVHTGPDEGTEWEIRVPRRVGTGRGTR